MAQQAKERHSIECQIHMSMSHGSIETNAHGQVLVPSKDAISIFQRLPGSPAYWRLFRNELYAKMEQYGPFHLFFTKSCAEARWACVLVEVLKVRLKRALKIMYYDNYEEENNLENVEESGQDNNENDKKEKRNVSWNGETSTVLVYDKTLTCANLQTIDKKFQNPELKKSRNTKLEEYIQIINDDHIKYRAELTKEAEDKTISATQMDYFEKETETMTSLGINLTQNKAYVSNLIENIIQLEDENNELKFNDVRYIATKLKPEEIKKIMTLDAYIDRYLKQHSMSKTDFLKDHFLLITRIFDKRVHDFMQTVMKDEGIEDYVFRIEFQLRGKNNALKIA